MPNYLPLPVVLTATFLAAYKVDFTCTKFIHTWEACIRLGVVDLLMMLLYIHEFSYNIQVSSNQHGIWRLFWLLWMNWSHGLQHCYRLAHSPHVIFGSISCFSCHGCNWPWFFCCQSIGHLLISPFLYLWSFVGEIKIFFEMEVGLCSFSLRIFSVNSQHCVMEKYEGNLDYHNQAFINIKEIHPPKRSHKEQTWNWLSWMLGWNTRIN